MDGGQDVSYQDPGTTRLKDINPEVFAETDYLRNLRDKYHSQFQSALEPALYDERAGRQKDISRTAIQNRYAQSGLAQSSASYGAQQQSDISIQDQFERQRVSDMMRAMQLEAALSGQITGNTMGAQGQFAQSQNQYNQSVLQQNASDQAMWGSIIGAGAMIGGTLLAGPVGGAAAGQLAGSMTGGGGGGMAAPSYAQPNYAQNMYNSAQYNYGYGY